MYYSMKNCSNSPDQLRELIMNIRKHYQVHISKMLVGFFQNNWSKKKRWELNEYCFEIFFIPWGGEGGVGKFFARGKNSSASSHLLYTIPHVLL